MVAIILSEKMRYLMVGGWNTIFGYIIGVGLFLILNQYMHIILIAILGNIISITMSFITYKLLVFKTRGRWLSEYLKCHLVYGVNTIIGILFLWFFVDRLSINIWLAQAAIILPMVIFSYLMHKFFTFKRIVLFH
jgi:putative flippase GtrA